MVFRGERHGGPVRQWALKNREFLINLCLVVTAVCFVLFVGLFVKLVFFPSQAEPRAPPPPEEVLGELRKRKPSGHTMDSVQFSEQLGKSTWFLLHSLAEAYPENPSVGERHRFISLLRGLEYFYPDPESRETWKNIKSLAHLQEIQLATLSRTHLKQWLCTFHNLVNVWLSKPQFDCTPANLAISPYADSLPHIRQQRENEFAESLGNEISAVEEATHTMTGPCKLPINPTLFFIQHDPIPNGFSLLSGFGPAPRTVIMFLTRECANCMVLLQQLSNLRPEVTEHLNILGVFEWSSTRPARQERALIMNEIHNIAPNLPILYEGLSGQDSWIDFLFPQPSGAPYFAILRGCEVELSFYPSQADEVMSHIARIIGDSSIVYLARPHQKWGIA